MEKNKLKRNHITVIRKTVVNSIAIVRELALKMGFQGKAPMMRQYPDVNMEEGQPHRCRATFNKFCTSVMNPLM